MKHHQKEMLIKARRIGAIILMCLLAQQLGLHNSQGDEQKLSSTTFMSLVDNRELFHGDRAETSAAPASSRQQQQQQRLSPPTIVTSHIPTPSVISAPPSPLGELLVEPPKHHEQRTMGNDNNRWPPSESIMKTDTTNNANHEIVSKSNHRVQRDQETGTKFLERAAKLSHLLPVANEIRPDQIYISEPAVPSNLKASEKATIKKGKGVLEWLKDKHRLKHAIGQTVLNEIETNKLDGDRRFAADGHNMIAAVHTPPPESIGADKLSIILMQDRLLADNAKSGGSLRLTPDKRLAPTITSVLSAPATPLEAAPVILVDKRHSTDPCATNHKALCFSKFLFGDSHSNGKKKPSVNSLASKTDLEHLISGEKASKIPSSGTNADASQRFMHFG